MVSKQQYQRCSKSGSGTAYLSFNEDGYDMLIMLLTIWNGSSIGDYVSWTFRKAEKFFDVVTYTGNGVEGRVLNHSLNSTPKFIIIKAIDATVVRIGLVIMLLWDLVKYYI